MPNRLGRGHESLTVHGSSEHETTNERVDVHIKHQNITRIRGPIDGNKRFQP